MGSNTRPQIFCGCVGKWLKGSKSAKTFPRRVLKRAVWKSLWKSTCYFLATCNKNGGREAVNPHHVSENQNVEINRAWVGMWSRWKLMPRHFPENVWKESFGRVFQKLHVTFLRRATKYGLTAAWPHHVLEYPKIKSIVLELEWSWAAHECQDLTFKKIKKRCLEIYFGKVEIAFFATCNKYGRAAEPISRVSRSLISLFKCKVFRNRDICLSMTVVVHLCL